MKEINIDLNNMHERELHPFLVYYLAKKMNIHSKTVYHEVSTKTGKGKSQWLHPDIVGFDLPVAKWDEKVLELCKEFSLNRATIYSFELKKSITTESLREQFFQAVSNSSWANEGYLVAVDIDTENKDLMQEINRLCSAFSIGVIKLNLKEPYNSEVIVPAIRKESLDGETMNKLFSINSDFKVFVETVLKSININQVVDYKLDKVLLLSELEEMLSEVKDNSPVDDYIEPNNSQENDYEGISLNSNFTNKSPKFIKIENDKIEGDTWKNLYLGICNYLIAKDKSIFKTFPQKMKGRKRSYFSKDNNQMKAPVLLENIDLYAELNLSANNIVSNIKKILNEYKIDESKVKVYLNEEQY